MTFRQAESSVDVSPRPLSGIASILVNYLQLEIDEVGHCRDPRGVFNYPTTWLDTVSYPSNTARGHIVGERTHTIVPGVSRRLNEEGVWQAFINRKEGWICLGEANLSPLYRN